MLDAQFFKSWVEIAVNAAVFFAVSGVAVTAVYTLLKRR